MREEYYKDKSVHYGMGHTRLRRILNLVGDVSGKKVLDVGCATGRLGELLKQKGAYVVGLEISESAAAQAQQKLDEVVKFDIEKPWPNMQHKFDMIIMSEVLEHIFDPVEVLKNARDRLADEGRILITTPNFMTWTNRAKFLFGGFKYQDQGMFDFGHIRWFTYPYLKDVLRKSGFGIESEKHIIFPGKLTAILKIWPSLFAWQFIIRARKV